MHAARGERRLNERFESMSNGVTSSNYVSDSAILAWVQIQQERQYGQLGATMDFETMRGQMATDAANIKQDMLKASNDTKAIPALNDEIKAFQDQYGDITEFADVTAKVAEYAETVSSKAGEMSGLSDQQATWDALPVPAEGEPDGRGPRPEAPGALNADDVKAWADTLDKIVDSSNQNEQLGMIHINEIKSTIDHTAEVASQLIKSSNDTTKFTINNFA
jgi:hypothetical protein